MTKKKNISQEDINTWKNYIKNPTDLIDKDRFKNENASDNNRYKYDLHGFTLLEANEKVKEIILSCVEKNYKEILLITGKGIHSKTESNVFTSSEYNKLKSTIPLFIKNKPELASKIKNITTAPNKEGGEGALIIKLKRPIK